MAQHPRPPTEEAPLDRARWLYAEDFVVACIEPTTGSIVRGVTPWYIWPPAHPTHLHIPCVCLVVLELLVDGELRLESGRLVAGPSTVPSASLRSTYRRVVCDESGPLNAQLKAACWYKHPALPREARPRFSRRSNPWWVLRDQLVAAGRLEYVGAVGGLLRGPRVRMLDTGHRSDLLDGLRRSVAAGTFTNDPREVGLIAALHAAHLERLVDDRGAGPFVDRASVASALPAGGSHVLDFMRRASERMTTS